MKDWGALLGLVGIGVVIYYGYQNNWFSPSAAPVQIPVPVAVPVPPPVITSPVTPSVPIAPVSAMPPLILADPAQRFECPPNETCFGVRSSAGCPNCL